LIRALAVSDVAARPYSAFLGESKQQRKFQPVPILLERPRDELYRRIDYRVDRMMEAGLLEEVKGLTGYKDHQALQTVGYKELFDYLENRYSLEEAIARIKQHTRNYAKRQLTWFRNQGNYTSFHPEDINGIMAFIKKHMGT
jgi:tRNA dimethylallyltransferase